MKFWHGLVIVLLIIAIAVFTIFMVSLVSAYEIICIEGDGGVKIWEDVNLSQNYTKKIALELLMETEEFENCTFTETPESDSRIIGMLNNNIIEKNEEIEKLKPYKIWMYIFFTISILLIIREGWLWLGNKIPRKSFNDMEFRHKLLSKDK